MAKRNTYFEDEVIQRKVDMKQFRRIARYLVPHRKTIIIVSVLMLISAVTAMLPPMLLRYIINHTVKVKDEQELVLVIAGMVVLAAIEIGINYAHQILMGKVGHNVISNTKRSVLSLTRVTF